MIHIIRLIMIFFISQYGANYLFASIELTPSKIDLYGIQCAGDTLYTYGDFGSLMISPGDGETWRQVKAFESGEIIGFFINSDSLTAFNDRGQAAVSDDGGYSWRQSALLPDSIFCVISRPGGWFVRTREYIASVNEKFELVNKFEIDSPRLDIPNYFQYKYSMIYFKDRLIITTDSTEVMQFDGDLNLLNTFSFFKQGLCSSHFSWHHIATNKETFYITAGKKIFKTNKFPEFSLLTEKGEYYWRIKINGKNLIKIEAWFNFGIRMISFDPSGKQDTIREINYSNRQPPRYVYDCLLRNNENIIIGEEKFIFKSQANEDIFISEFCDVMQWSVPDMTGKNEFLMIPGMDFQIYSPYIYKSTNNGITWRTTVDTSYSDLFKKYKTFSFKYYDTSDKKLFIGTGIYDNPTGDVLISDENARFFEFKPLQYFTLGYGFIDDIFKVGYVPDPVPTTTGYAALCHTYYKNIYYPNVFTYDKDFNLESRFIDTGYVSSYIHLKDTNNFLLHCVNMSEYTHEIKYTTDRGKNWTMLKKYRRYDSLQYWKNFNFKGEKITAFFHFCYDDSIATLEFLYPEDFSEIHIDKIYSYKINSWGYQPKACSAIEMAGDTMLLAINDTLFRFTDPYDRESWEYMLLPDNGKILRTLKKFDDRFYIHYMDDNHPDAAYWMTLDFEADLKEAEIQAGDTDFETFDISDAEYPTAKISIENLSPDSNLEIYGIDQAKESIFSLQNIAPDSLNPFVIEPLEHRDINIAVSPDSAGIYRDSIYFESNAPDGKAWSILRTDITDTIDTGIDFDIEVIDYLAVSKPYPSPATNNITFMTYWDLNSDIEKDQLVISDILGNQIGGWADVTLNKTAPYKGYINWHCSNVPSGIYIIRIQRKSVVKSVKVVVYH